MKLTIHRSADQIGGNCIELEASGERLVLDVGRPLDAPKEAENLLPGSLSLQQPATVLISHPHQDHYGLLNELPGSWRVFSGAATEKLIRLTAGITGGAIKPRFEHWNSGEPLNIGRFTVTPLLTDHSAFDAYMLLIEAEGRRVLYSGDFRVHGRKSALVERLMADPPANIDVLLLEGTNLGSDKPTQSEADLEDEFVYLFRETPGRVFVAWSAQNVDRTVTLYRAALKAQRTLVVDLYAAEVLGLLADHGRLPRAGMDNLKVVITSRMSKRYKRMGDADFVEHMASGGRGVSAAALARNPAKWVIMLRESLWPDYERKGINPTAEDAWSWSLWRGYLPDVSEGMMSWLAKARAKHIHTSGHASPQHLRDFARVISPKILVPIHSFTWDENMDGFISVRRLRDGETLTIC